MAAKHPQEENVRYLCIAHQPTRKLLSDLTVLRSPSSFDFARETAALISGSSFPVDVPTLISKPAGNFCVLSDEHHHLFVSLTADTYPPRLAAALVRDLQNQFYEHNPAAKTADSTCPAALKTDFMTTLGGRYNDPKQWDRLAEAQHKVDELRLHLQESLQKVAGQSLHMGELEQQTFELKNEAKGFNQDAGRLENLGWWQNRKMCLLISCCSLAVILVVSIGVYVYNK